MSNLDKLAKNFGLEEYKHYKIETGKIYIIQENDMGNRAVIKFKNNEGKISTTGIYLHWNGGRASIEAFLSAARTLEIPSNDDYCYSRLAQIICNFIGTSNSVGVDNTENLDCNNEDNGVYIVQNLEIVAREFSDEDKDEINLIKTKKIELTCLIKNLPFFYPLKENYYAKTRNKVKTRIKELKQEIAALEKEKINEQSNFN